MLKGIDPLLNADVLYALRAMGHGDDLIIADTNFPAYAMAEHTVLGKPLRIDASAARAIRAILTLYPLDTFVDDAAACMQVVDNPHEVPAVRTEVQAVIDEMDTASRPLKLIERFAFYERAKQAFCIVQTDERRFYGCFALRKGVVPPEV